MTVDELFAALVRTLDRIAELAALGKERWDADELLRLAIQRLWITAGNYAEEYRKAAGIDLGVNPWAELYDYRCILAHHLPEELSEERVWHDTLNDVDRLRDHVRSTGSKTTRP